jgi:hypothetical protein
LAGFGNALRIYECMAEDVEVKAHWEMANYMTVVKMGYNDHGETHAKIATAYGLAILRLLLAAGALPDLIADGLGSEEDAYVVVTTATLLHDIGNQAGRHGHEALGVYLAMPILHRLLTPVYPKVDQRVKLIACIAHAILTHDLNPSPLTLEAAVVAVGDGADLTQGRGRIAFDLGKVDIHSVSALAVNSVEVRPGKDAAVEIFVTMSNAAGVFQVEQTLTKKVVNTALRDWVTVTAVVEPGSEATGWEQLSLRHGRFVATRGDSA